MSLQYYYNTNINEVNNLLTNGFIYDYYKIQTTYGKGIYLTSNKQQTSKNNIILSVQIKSLDNILIVDNYDNLISNFFTTKITIDINVNINSVNNDIINVGDIILLTGQNDVSQNGHYIYIGRNLPLLKVIDINNYIINTENKYIVGEKHIKPLLQLRGYNGIKILRENILILYNINEIKNIKINEN